MESPRRRRRLRSRMFRSFIFNGEAEDRNPKSESNPKSECRNPKRCERQDAKAAKVGNAKRNAVEKRTRSLRGFLGVSYLGGLGGLGVQLSSFFQSSAKWWASTPTLRELAGSALRTVIVMDEGPRCGPYGERSECLRCQIEFRNLHFAIASAFPCVTHPPLLRALRVSAVNHPPRCAAAFCSMNVST
jgi:hypothetical protein